MKYDNEKSIDIDDNKAEHEPNPLDLQYFNPPNTLSLLTFRWVGSLIARGAHSTLNEATLWAVRPVDAAENLSVRLLGFWRQERQPAAEIGNYTHASSLCDGISRWQSNDLSLLRATVLAFVATGAHRTGIILLIITVVHILRAYAIGRLCLIIADPSITGSLWIWATALVVLSLIEFQLQHLYSFMSSRASMQLRTALTSAAFDKLLHIPLLAFKGITPVQAANLVLNEIESCTRMAGAGHYLWAGPLEVIAGLVVGSIVTLGPAFACGFVLQVALSLLRLRCERRFNALQNVSSDDKNERLQLTSQVFNYMRSIKMCGWEFLVADRIVAARAREVAGIRYALIQRAMCDTLHMCGPGLVAALAFAFHVFCFKQVLSTEQVVSTLALYTIIQAGMNNFILHALKNCSAAHASMQTLQRFMELPDAPLPPAAQTPPPAAVRRRRRALAQKALRKSAAKTKVLAKDGLGGFSATLSDLAEGCEDEADDLEGADLFADRMEDLLPCEDDFPPPPRRWRSLSMDQGGNGSASETDVSESDGEWGASVHALLGHVPVLEVHGLSTSWQGQNGSLLVNRIGGTVIDLDAAENTQELKTKESKLNTAEQVLRDVSFECRLGEVVVVVGPEGCGKSSLLFAILGELSEESVTKRTGTTIDGGDKDVQLPSVMVLDPDHRDDGPMTARRVVYFGQDQVVFNGSLRACVTFGELFDLDLYNACLSACQLLEVVKMLPHGDMTNLSEDDGVLSSSQRRCLGLARCCYSALCRDDVHLVLLDDPFSIFDRKVASEFFDAIIGGPRALLRHKAVVLCTRQVQQLHSSAVGRILALDQSGRVAAYGPFLQVRSRIEVLMSESCGDDISERVKNRTSGSVCTRVGLNTRDEDLSSTSVKSKLTPADEGAFDNVVDFARIGSGADGLEDAELRHDVEILDHSAANDNSQPRESSHGDEHSHSASNGNNEVATAVESNNGALSWETYKIFCSMTIGSGATLWLIIFVIATQVVAMAVPAWIVQWSLAHGSDAANDDNLVDDQVNSGGTAKEERADTSWQQGGSAWAFGLAVLAILSLLMSFACAYNALTKLLDASEKLRDTALRRVLQAPIDLFGDSLYEQILSRFHKDVGILEDRLPYTFLNFSKCCAWCFVVFILAITADIPVIAAAVPFSAVFVWLYRYSKPCNRCLAHIEAKSRRQIGRHLVELMHGAVAIRAAKQEAFIRAAGFKVLDANTRANFALLAQTHWLGYRLDALCISLFGACIFAATLTCELTDASSYEPSPLSSSSPPFLAGNGFLVLSLFCVLQLSEFGNQARCLTSDLDTHMVSAKRLVDFAHLPQATALGIGTSNETQISSTNINSCSSTDTSEPLRSGQKWPSVGNLEVRNLSVKQSNISPALGLHGISFAVQPGKRVGVVSCSGVEKSILVAALLRLIDLESGHVMLDGVDVATVNLHELRHAITVVSQASNLLFGTLRFNLDPFGKHSDAGIWNALRDVQMAATVGAIPSGLTAMMGEEEKHFDAGERQLLCLARALLQDTKVLIFDQAESSSNVDFSSETRLREVIRTKFNHCSVLALADKLETVVDYDHVIVLEQGRVIEQGPPQDLLMTMPVMQSDATPTSPFYTSVAKSTVVDSSIDHGIGNSNDHISANGIESIFDN